MNNIKGKCLRDTAAFVNRMLVFQQFKKSKHAIAILNHCVNTLGARKLQTAKNRHIT